MFGYNAIRTCACIGTLRTIGWLSNLWMPPPATESVHCFHDGRPPARLDLMTSKSSTSGHTSQIAICDHRIHPAPAISTMLPPMERSTPPSDTRRRILHTKPIGAWRIDGILADSSRFRCGTIRFRNTNQIVRSGIANILKHSTDRTMQVEAAVVF